jgi:predicted lipoprotein with Yx(FWY)xxD motif
MLMDGNLKGLDGVTYTSKYVPGVERVKYLVDAYGRTLYTFSRDSLLKNKFTNSTFSNNVVWPIYNDTLKSFPSGISDTLFKLATVFGRPQLAFKGWPLYQYSQDSIRGQTKGITVGAIGRWPVAAPTLANAPSTITAVQDAFRDKLTLRLSPVPTHDVLQVELSSEISGDASGTLYNLNGQAVKQFNFRLYQGKNLTRLDLSTLSTGLYLLSLKIDGQPAAYEKIIKQ